MREAGDVVAVFTLRADEVKAALGWSQIMLGAVKSWEGRSRRGQEERQQQL